MLKNKAKRRLRRAKGEEELEVILLKLLLICWKNSAKKVLKTADRQKDRKQ